MRTNPVFDNPAAFRAAKKATLQATLELNATPRHLLDRGNPNHPENFDRPNLTGTPFEVAGVKFTAIRYETPAPHGRLSTDENGHVFDSGAGFISNQSVPKMQASLQMLFDETSKGDVGDFRDRLGLV